MKKAVLSIALACVAPFAWGQVSQTTTTTTTTDALIVNLVRLQRAFLFC